MGRYLHPFAGFRTSTTSSTEAASLFRPRNVHVKIICNVIRIIATYSLWFSIMWCVSLKTSVTRYVAVLWALTMFMYVWNPCNILPNVRKSWGYLKSIRTCCNRTCSPSNTLPSAPYLISACSLRCCRYRDGGWKDGGGEGSCRCRTLVGGRTRIDIVIPHIPRVSKLYWSYVNPTEHVSNIIVHKASSGDPIEHAFLSWIAHCVGGFSYDEDTTKRCGIQRLIVVYDRTSCVEHSLQGHIGLLTKYRLWNFRLALLLIELFVGLLFNVQ